ncbi:MAG: 3-isopropylmalate dehydrogenase, partial [Parcubacteria group bacterium GW2011_GWA2_49_9]
KGFGMYEPIHGSAPKMAGLGTANPTSQFLSLAMLLRHSFGLTKEAEAIEKAIVAVWAKGVRTKDLVPKEQSYASTSQFSAEVIKEILHAHK